MKGSLKEKQNKGKIKGVRVHLLLVTSQVFLDIVPEGLVT